MSDSNTARHDTTPAWLPDAVFGFTDGEAQARELALRLAVPYETVEVHYFPDAECKVRIQGRARRPIVYRPLDHPNAKLIDGTSIYNFAQKKQNSEILQILKNAGAE